MGCGPGGTVQRWLQALELDSVVTFNPLDPDGYDRIDLPDFRFRIPTDLHRFEADLLQAFPADRDGIVEFFEILWRIDSETRASGIDLKRVLRQPFEFKDTVLYGPWPVKRVFDHLKLSARVRAVIAGQCGDIGLSPREERCSVCRRCSSATASRHTFRGVAWVSSSIASSSPSPATGARSPTTRPSRGWCATAIAWPTSKLRADSSPPTSSCPTSIQRGPSA